MKVREPAPLWARAVRELDAQNVLFSATPFRNDLKLFDVDMDFVHFLSFAEAVKDSLIRDVEIDERDLPEDAAGFAKQAIAAWDALVASGRFRRSAKMIVRAGNEDEIDALYAAVADQLKGRSEGVLAL